MKNTTRHKIGLNPARGSGECCELPRAPEALALFMFLERKIQHLINIPAPNLLKLTSRKRDIHSGVKSTQKLYSSKSFVPDKKTT